jgi:GNAT superfamily N-acetyltransferase
LTSAFILFSIRFMVTSDSPCCRLLVPNELTECLQWALPRYPLERASWILTQLTGLVQSGRTSQILGCAVLIDPLQPLDRKNVQAVAVAAVQSGGAANLLILQVNDELDTGRQETAADDSSLCDVQNQRDQQQRIGKQRLKQLLDLLLRRLRDQSVTFLQSACNTHEQAGLLDKAGLQPLADLSLMVLTSDMYGGVIGPAGWSRISGRNDGSDYVSGNSCGSTPAAAAPPLEWIRLEAIDDWPAVFSAVAASTFIDTRDCPLLSKYRSADEIVDGYRTAPGFDPALSRLLRLDGQWAGCLVLTRHSDLASEPATEPATKTAAEPAGESGDGGPAATVALDLTYMGLIPEFRQKRLSAVLLAETVRVAAQIGAYQIVVAVDKANRPAVASYQRFGWREIAAESVWGMRIALQNTAILGVADAERAP